MLNSTLDSINLKSDLDNLISHQHKSCLIYWVSQIINFSKFNSEDTSFKIGQLTDVHINKLSSDCINFFIENFEQINKTLSLHKLILIRKQDNKLITSTNYTYIIQKLPIIPIDNTENQDSLSISSVSESKFDISDSLDQPIIQIDDNNSNICEDYELDSISDCKVSKKRRRPRNITNLKNRELYLKFWIDHLIKLIVTKPFGYQFKFKELKEKSIITITDPRYKFFFNYPYEIKKELNLKGFIIEKENIDGGVSIGYTFKEKSKVGKYNKISTQSIIRSSENNKISTQSIIRSSENNKISTQSIIRSSENINTSATHHDLLTATTKSTENISTFSSVPNVQSTLFTSPITDLQNSIFPSSIYNFFSYIPSTNQILLESDLIAQQNIISTINQKRKINEVFLSKENQKNIIDYIKKFDLINIDKTIDEWYDLFINYSVTKDELLNWFSFGNIEHDGIEWEISKSSLKLSDGNKISTYRIKQVETTNMLPLVIKCSFCSCTKIITISPEDRTYYTSLKELVEKNPSLSKLIGF